MEQKLLIPMDEEEAKKEFQDEEDLEQSWEEAQTKGSKPTILRII